MGRLNHLTDKLAKGLSAPSYIVRINVAVIRLGLGRSQRSGNVEVAC